MTLVRFARTVDPSKGGQSITLQSGVELYLGQVADLSAAEIASLSDRYVLTPYTPSQGDSGGSGVASWATGAQYTIGQVVTNGGKLYQAADAHTAGTSFSGDLATHWTQLDQETDALAIAQLGTHAALTTAAHGGLVASSDSRLTDVRPGKAVAWAATTVYKAGQIVTYSGQAYTANADFTSGASFVASNWTAVSSGSSVYLDATDWVGKTPTTSDRLTQLQQALNAARDQGPGARLLLPYWPVVCGGSALFDSYVAIEGLSAHLGGLKLGDGSNVDLLKTRDFDALYAAKTAAATVQGDQVVAPGGTLTVDSTAAWPNATGYVRAQSGLVTSQLAYSAKTGTTFTLTAGGTFTNGQKVGNPAQVGGQHHWTLDRLKLDANRFNNAHGRPLATFGIGELGHVRCLRSPDNVGWFSSWGGAGTSDAVDSIEMHVERFEALYNQGGGAVIDGPHDMIVRDLIAQLNGTIDAAGNYPTSGGTSVSLDVTDDAAGLQMGFVHLWGRNTDIGMRTRATGTRVSNFESESAQTSLLDVLASEFRMDGGALFRASPQAANGVPACTGLRLGDTDHAVASCDVRCTADKLEAGVFALVNDAGGNRLEAVAYQPVGPLATGTKHASSRVAVVPHAAFSGTKGYAEVTNADVVVHNGGVLNPAATGYFLLGTIQATKSGNRNGARAKLVVLGNQGFAAATDTGHTEIDITFLAGAQPNAVATFRHFIPAGATPSISNVVLVQTGSDPWTFEVRARIRNGAGRGALIPLLGNEVAGMVWTPGGMAASTDPGGASSTVVLAAENHGINAASIQVGATGQKVGFLGATPVVRPTLAAAATDATTTQTLANSLRTALINLGLGV